MALTKGSQTPSRWSIAFLVLGLVHSDQLKDKVCQSCKEDGHDEAHGNLLLPSCAPSGKNQESNGERKDSNRDKELIVLAGKASCNIAASGGNDNNELNSEPDEKEKIELQKGDENL